jgi:hypothetical protein
MRRSIPATPRSPMSRMAKRRACPHALQLHLRQDQERRALADRRPPFIGHAIDAEIAPGYQNRDAGRVGRGVFKAFVSSRIGTTRTCHDARLRAAIRGKADASHDITLHARWCPGPQGVAASSSSVTCSALAISSAALSSADNPQQKPRPGRASHTVAGATHSVGNGFGFPLPVPPANQAAARQDQAGQASTGYRSGNADWINHYRKSVDE